ncbi:MAG: right-handed parallel beta-helix repeat-containing protein [Theionarchaea archaeon]|nr:right-handed parallel beta-helix repeat-containing protein [Theionarchaea archaeon]
MSCCFIFLLLIPIGATVHHVYPGAGTPIQDAIDVASSGDTIIVHPGTYSENITLSKDNLILVSSGGPAVTIINYVGIWCGYWSTGNGGVDIPYGVQGVVVEGFTILGGSPASDALVSVGGDNTIIRNNIVIGDPGSSGQDIGIHIGDVSQSSPHYPSSNQVIGNEIYNHAGSGIFIGNWAGTGNIVSRNIVHGNVLGGIPSLNGNGIEIDRALGVRVMNNLVFNNQAAGIRVIRTAPGAIIDIFGNTLSTNTNGIHSERWRTGATTSALVTVTCNNIMKNSQFGMRNDEAVTIMAERNWWGHTSGPFHATLNLHGAGNHVSDFIDFFPWGLVLDPCDPLISGSEYSQVLKKQVCSLARYNVQEAEKMLESVQGLMGLLGVDENLLSDPYLEAQSLIAEAEVLLEKARLFCQNSQNCIAGNTLAVEALTLLDQANELLEALLG